ncbi:MAG: branched-chain amino acid aminotransferase [Thermodesulfobacteriota bacterium]
MEIRIERVEDGKLKAKPRDNNLGFGSIFSDYMFVMNYSAADGWHGARVCPYQNFSLDPAAMVFHYGQAIFEGLKAYRGKDDKVFFFRPEDNLRRMNKSAVRMCMPEIDRAQILKALKLLVGIEKDWVPDTKGSSLYIRPTMVASEPGLGVRPAREYLFFIILSPVGAYYSEGFNPVTISITDKYVRAVRGGVGDVKTAGNYAASIMAAVEAQEQGYTQVLWLDALERKYVEEVGTMNIFFVIGDELITPPLSGSILPGITRDCVLRLTEDWGWQVVERPITIDEVFRAADNGSLREVFGTGTAAVISPVGALYYKGDICTVNGGQAGELALRLFQEFQDMQYGYKDEPYGWVHQLEDL